MSFSEENKASSFTVREIQPEEIGAVVEAAGSVSLLERYGVDQKSLMKLLEEAVANKDRILLGAFDCRMDENDEFVGFALFSSEGTFLTGGYLKLLVVVPKWQKKGVGRKLVEAMEAHVGAKSINLFLLVSHFNEGAQRFYEGLGYRRVGAIDGLVLADVSEVIYWKRLDR